MLPVPGVHRYSDCIARRGGFAGFYCLVALLHFAQRFPLAQRPTVHLSTTTPKSKGDEASGPRQKAPARIAPEVSTSTRHRPPLAWAHAFDGMRLVFRLPPACCHWVATPCLTHAGLGRLFGPPCCRHQPLGFVPVPAPVTGAPRPGDTNEKDRQRYVLATTTILVLCTRSLK